MEHAINSIFDFKGTSLKVVQSDTCSGCFFDRTDDCGKQVCSKENRSDGRCVHFEEIGSMLEVPEPQCEILHREDNTDRFVALYLSQLPRPFRVGSEADDEIARGLIREAFAFAKMVEDERTR